MSTPIRLILVDSSELFRQGLVALLKRRRSLEVVGEAASGSQALALVHELHPDLLVLDPDVPDAGYEFIAALAREAPECAVLVLTDERDGERAAKTLHAGAQGILLKEQCTPDDLVRAIERVHAGELVIVPAVADSVRKSLAGESPRAMEADGLTEREREVLQLVAQGLTNPQIAQELCITEYTVKAHIARILNKLALDNRVQIAAYAVERGLAEAGGERREHSSAPT